MEFTLDGLLFLELLITIICSGGADMRRLVSALVSGLMVVSICAVFTSCGSVSCSLDNITLSLDSNPTFVLDEETTSSMSQEQFEEKQSIVSLSTKL